VFTILDKRKIWFLLIFVCLTVSAICTNTATVHAEATEIKYDDGSAGTGWTKTPKGLGGMFAVRFTPPYTPCLLKKVRYYIYDDPATFKVRILDSNKNDITPALTVTPSSKGWYDVDLAQHDIAIAGDFYVGFEQIVAYKPYLGFDQSDPDGRSWFVDNGNWKSSAELTAEQGVRDGDFMIRAVVEPALDSDGDGLYDYEEKVLGTDPKKADTDNDGLNDKMEKDLGTNPLKADTDEDGLIDGDEVNKHQTDPLKADTDKDGLSDGDEVNKFKTDPLKVDTDGDGLLDGEEVTKYQTDPLKTDTDGDGLNDKDEILKGTNPTKADSDGDGLNDADELSMKTDPLRVDTDGDGLTDGDEVKKGADPLKVDTDGDFLNDSVDPMPANVFVPDVLVLAVIVAIVIAVFAFRRKKKAAPPWPPTPEAPAVPPTPPPVEAPAVTPVPTIKFCVHCGAQIPVESIYCGKCGGRQ